MAPSKYHRLPAGERCDECGARQWYAEDALRYCRNGHRLEGFAAHEADEDAFGTAGKVHRKKREKRQKVAVKLAGAEGRELYLEVLQLVLMRQIRWFIEECIAGREGGRELEGLVRALWSLWVRDLGIREQRGGKEEGEDSDAASRSSRFTSQTTQSQPQSQWSETGESSDIGLSDATTAIEGGKRYKVPRLIDTLALCYLGCLLRRLPVTIADFHHWAQKSDIDYLAAFHGIPRNVRDRLPAQYHRAMQIRDHLAPGKLLSAVQELVLLYKAKYDIKVPPLNYVPPLYRYIEELTLPVEVFGTVQALAEILEVDFLYPAPEGRKRVRTMQNPEVLLMTLVLVATKLLFPLDRNKWSPTNYTEPRIQTIDWTRWQKIVKDKPAEECTHLTRGEEYKITAYDALEMEKTKVDDYMDWFERMWIGDGDPRTTERLRQPFQGESRPSQPSQARDDRDERTRRRYEALHDIIESFDSGTSRKEDADCSCPVWRTEEDLPEAAKAVYSQAAELAALPLSTLIQCAVQVERQLELWNDRQKSKGKGKGKAAQTEGQHE
ncbi:hypothetical protein F5Y15DRAFT_74907 [Xylariaceae sp. FL0016]|nr:hypothetical protein F5Y15DRAFT_74907 [Xylariaceae sp. FL0016]